MKEVTETGQGYSGRVGIQTRLRSLTHPEVLHMPVVAKHFKHKPLVSPPYAEHSENEMCGLGSRERDPRMNGEGLKRSYVQPSHCLQSPTPSWKVCRTHLVLMVAPANSDLVICNEPNVLWGFVGWGGSLVMGRGGLGQLMENPV